MKRSSPTWPRLNRELHGNFLLIFGEQWEFHNNLNGDAAGNDTRDILTETVVIAILQPTNLHSMSICVAPSLTSSSTSFAFP
ncbi:hypothetical protein HMPREF9233_00856 [Actinobaculum massiliense ACS-171-V-Col2]|uniref:Uncharacterized protein n=1 Tax=Actinobaculum massiliense ACS-171-V-Col2 TaxID=883066 RepID=K9F0R6_9ACTO|nr:hypothetical protein HMPREF9233_00856 [Actinobaculum massiliense ACS-171-V-Col2]